MNNPLTTLSDTAKGILLMIGGALLLFNTLGIIERGVNLIIIAGSLVMIFYGIVMSKTHRKIYSLFKKSEGM